jgi:DNA polymerase-3 subunit alpha
VYEDIVDRTLERRREEQAGISTLFSSVEGFAADGDTIPGGPAGYADVRVPIPATEFAKTQRLAFEKEMLGLYVSDHPLRGVEAPLSRLVECSIADLKEEDVTPDSALGRDGQVRTVGGVVTALVRRYTRRGELMATFTLEDLRASIEVFVFPRVMADMGALLADDAVVVLRGRIDTRDDQVKLVCMEVTRPELTVEGASELHVRVPVGIFTGDAIDRLKQLLKDNPGDEPVFLHVGETVLRLSGEFNVNSRRGLVGELRVLLGPNAIA